MRLLNDRERVLALTCPTSGQSIHLRFRREAFGRPIPKPLACPACHGDHSELASRLAAKNGLQGWAVKLREGNGPRGYEIAAAYGA